MNKNFGLKRLIQSLDRKGLGHEDICVRAGVTKDKKKAEVRSYYFEIAEGNKDVDGILPRMHARIRH